MHRFSIADYKKQLYRDLVGKDSFRGITLTYGWLANQAGHAFLGFLLAVIILCAINLWIYCSPSTWGASWPSKIRVAAIGSAFGWLVFEVFNVLNPFKDIEDYAAFGLPYRQVYYDVFIDMMFFFLGATLFAIAADNFMDYFPILIVLIVVASVGFYSWYTNKMMIQTGGHPFQFRLKQWVNKATVTQVDNVKKFMTKGSDTASHLIIFGPALTGKSKLAVGAATEKAHVKWRSYYTTSTDMESNLLDFDQVKKVKETNYEMFWSIYKSQIQVIDDIGGGIFVQAGNIVVSDPLLDAMKSNPILRKKVLRKNCNSIWVISSSVPSDQSLWVKYFTNHLGVPSSDISIAVNSVKLVQALT